MESNKGFTLIELMIVIAIIGILAAIALPAYSDYVGRSQAVEAIRLANGLQSEVDIWHNDTGMFPDETAVASNGHIGALAKNLKGKYIQDNGVTVTADTGIINVPFDAGTNANAVLRMEPVLSLGKIISWTCTGTLEPGRLPNSCQ